MSKTWIDGHLEYEQDIGVFEPRDRQVTPQNLWYYRQYMMQIGKQLNLSFEDWQLVMHACSGHDDVAFIDQEHEAPELHEYLTRLQHVYAARGFTTQVGRTAKNEPALLVSLSK